MKEQHLYITVIASFIWVGFIGAISFMEAWLKFQASGLSISVGLGIGKLVFNALNKVELSFAALIIINQVVAMRLILTRVNSFYLIALGILIVQTVYLLPSLETRADTIINGGELTPSNLHKYYILAEIIKVLCLVIFGWSTLDRIKRKQIKL